MDRKGRLFEAVFNLGLETHAHALEYAEAEMAAAYPSSGTDNAWYYLLLGDPEMEIRHKNLPALVVIGPTKLEHLESLVKIKVLGDAGLPVSDVLVSIFKPGFPGGPDEVLANRYTGLDGVASIPLAPMTTGELTWVARDFHGSLATGTIPVGCGFETYGADAVPANPMALTGSGETHPGGVALLATSGVPGATCFTVLSAAQLEFPMPEGTLLIHPGALLLIEGAAASGGEASVLLPIPDVPSLVGAEAFAQSVAPLLGPGGPTLVFSNGLRIEVCPKPAP